MCERIVAGPGRVAMVNRAMVKKSAPELFLVPFTLPYGLFGLKLGPSRL
jgi:hypothetical protein